MESGEDLESGAERETSRRSVRSGSSSESERKRGHRSDAKSDVEGRSSSGPRSLKEKRRKVQKEVSANSKLAAGAAVLLGTLSLIWFLGLLPFGLVPSFRQPDSSRVIHLVLAGDESRKARFGLSKSMTWDLFISGVQDRLKIQSVDRIETSAGISIRAVEDLLHRDNLIVYEGNAEDDQYDEEMTADPPPKKQIAKPRSVKTSRENTASSKGTAQRQSGLDDYKGNPIAQWTIDDVVRFFSDLKLVQYLDAIRQNEVTGRMLLELEKDSEAMKELGVSSKLHMSKIRSAMKGLSHT